MQKMYCGDCQEYLMTPTGDCKDCHCGWRQSEKSICCSRCYEYMPEIELAQNDGKCIHCEKDPHEVHCTTCGHNVDIDACRSNSGSCTICKTLLIDD